MITFSCTCGKQLAAKEEHAGKQTVCPQCGNRLTIPVTAAPAQLADNEPGGDAPRDERRERDDDVPRQPRADDDDRARGRYRDDDDERADRRRRRRYEDDRDDDNDDRDRPRRRRDSGETSGAAVTSLITGIICFFCPLLIPNLIAIITGIMGLVAAGQGKKGRGMAIAGLILGSVTLLCIPLNVALLLPAVQKVREAAASTQSANNLKQIGIAVHSHMDAYQHMPQAAIFDEQTGKPLLSWRVKILPFIEQENLYREFHLNEPWDSPHNIQLLHRMPKIYAHPSTGAENTSMTHYQAFVATTKVTPGPAFVLDKEHRIGLAQMHDGTSNTLLVVEATNPVEWSKPADLPFPIASVPALGVQGDMFNVLMADGLVFRRSSRNLNVETLRRVVTMNDNEVIPGDWFDRR